MTLLIDDHLVTTPILAPLLEGWVPFNLEIQPRTGLQAGAVGPGDVALISSAQATLLAETHVIVPDVAIVLDGTGPIAMRTPVRPDEVETSVIRMLDTGPTAEILIRALLQPYFGIIASGFAWSDDDHGAEDAQVVIVDEGLGLSQPESGFQSDLVRDWFVLTGDSVVSHVVVAGREAIASGIDGEIAALKEAVAVGQERRRDVRSIAAAAHEITDREVFAAMTNKMRFALTDADRRSLLNLVARGTWGSRFGKQLPLFLAKGSEDA